MVIGRNIFVFLALSVTAVGLRAQEPVDTVASLSGIEVQTSVDRAESYIGDLITYTLTINYDSTCRLVPPPLGANLGAFDVKDYKPDIETKLDNGRLQSQTIFVLSTYTTGDYVIPSLPIMFLLPDSTRKLILSESVPIKILSLLDQAGTDSLDIKPLKAQYEFPPDYSKYYLYGGLGLVVLLLGAGAFGWWLWRRRRAQAAVDLRAPWEIAFEKLAYLRVKYLDNEIADQIQAKEFYVQLTEIVRDFLGKIYETDVLEMTTEQFLDAFRDKELPNHSYDQLRDFFRQADQVKFAKLMPERAGVEDDFMTAHDVTEKVRADYERRRQSEFHAAQSPVEPQEEKV
jgi:hypothetical protein